MEYGTVVYNPYKWKIIQKIENVRNIFTGRMIIRVIVFDYAHIPNSRERNANFHLSSQALRRKKADLIMFHKIVNVLCGLPSNKFCTWKNSITRGASLKLVVPRARLGCRKHFFTVRAASDYAKINETRGIPANIHSFRAFLNSRVGSLHQE